MSTGSLVLWSTILLKAFGVMSHGKGFSEDLVLISGFSITTNAHTAATNTGGSVITLVLRKLTVGRVKEALEKHQPPSPGGDWPTEKQQVGADDIASEILQTS
ncbi:hypothetical protein Tco_0583304 [Tanacetum coccineum]